ncbi:hypothetical protein E1H18_3468 [Caulobacter sp. RHG1]|nr:hypothetical protein [Caulobacter sp. RHG1]
MLLLMSQTQAPAARCAVQWCAEMQAKIMAVLDAAWDLAENSSDPAVIALAREKAKACGQIAATVRKVATMVPAPKAAKSQQPLDVIEGVVGRLDKATKASEPDARPAAAQAVAMRAALRKLGRR